MYEGCRHCIGVQNRHRGFRRDIEGFHAAKIASVAMKEAVKRAGIDPAVIDDVRFGCCLEPVDTMNVTRIAALMAGIPETVTAVTVNRVCISGMEAVVSGMAMIQAGMADVILAGGVEHMSGAAYSVPDARWGCRLQDQVFVDHVMRGLHCGSHLIPHPEEGPVEASHAAAQPVQGQALHHGRHGGIRGPAPQHHPGGDGRGGPAQPQQRRAGDQKRGFQRRDRADQHPSAQGAPHRL